MPGVRDSDFLLGTCRFVGLNILCPDVQFLAPESLYLAVDVRYVLLVLQCTVYIPYINL